MGLVLKKGFLMVKKVLLSLILAGFFKDFNIITAGCRGQTPVYSRPLLTVEHRNTGAENLVLEIRGISI